MISFEEFQDVEHYIARARRSQALIEVATDASELRDAWEEFLGHFGRAIGRMITLGKIDVQRRPWAHRLKNLSSHDDRGLMYLREARNSVEHGVKPFAAFRNPSVHIRPLGELSAGNVSIINSSINGVQVDGNLIISGGRVQARRGNVPFVELPAQVVLQTIHNPEKKRDFEVPSEIFGRMLDSKRPCELAMKAIDVLNELHNEFVDPPP